ncbi:Peptidase S8/S53 domain [Sesbania bispinosa]|nr:Peptidase S8/S53 domain [Sesbania bispinosa]
MVQILAQYGPLYGYHRSYPAFDDAIRDGVHILSLSLGAQSPQGDYFSDAISVGSFHAASRGVLVVASAGNEGRPGSATNLAPWILTAAASSTDRDFTSDIILGNGAKITGESLSLSGMNASTRIIPASEAFAGYFTPYQSSYCLESSLNKTNTTGKVLVCRHVESSTESKVAKSKVVKEAGGVGMILIVETDQDVATPFVIPSAIVGKKTGERILSYLKTTREPMSRIFRAKTVLGARLAPRVAAFSSKGPNALNPEILKVIFSLICK